MTTHSPPPREPADFELPGRDDEVLRVRGHLLGFTSSERVEHSHPTELLPGNVPVTPVPGGTRCSACRWFEARILRVDVEYSDDCTCGADPLAAPGEPRSARAHTDACGELDARARYLVLTYGRTRVSGETDKRRAAWTDSGFEVVEFLTQRSGGDVFLPTAAARVLAQAAPLDEGIYEAYVNRAVA